MTMRLFFLILTFVLAGVMTYLHQQALLHFWYWKDVGFDTVMHFLGGVTLGTFAVGLSQHRRTLFFILFILVGSFLWEVFEFSIGVSGGVHFLLDTTRDVGMDILGAMLVYLVVRLTLWRSK